MWTICTLFLLFAAGTLTYTTDKPFALPLVSGNTSSTPVGGNTSSTIDHPYLVALVKDGGNRWNLTCGGAIINESYVLTAANCMKYASETLYVVAGTKDLQKGSGQTRCISEIIVRAGGYLVSNGLRTHDGRSGSAHGCGRAHFGLCTMDPRKHRADQASQHIKLSATDTADNYNSSVPYGRSDVAVVKLTSPLTLKAGEVEKAALNTNTSCPVSGASCTVLGWRNTNGQQSDIRQQCSTDIYGLESCKKKYENSTSTRLNDGNVCAGNKSANGRDVCQSASGSPLVCQCAGNDTVVGAVSCSRECGLADGPGVYTSVAYFHDWISLSNFNDSRTHTVRACPGNDSGPVAAGVIAGATIGAILFVIVVIVIIIVRWRMCKREGKFCQRPRNGSQPSSSRSSSRDNRLMASSPWYDYNTRPADCSSRPYELIPTSGDGRCLFRSLVIGTDSTLQKAERTEHGALTNPVLEVREVDQADDLRARVITYMFDHFEDYCRLEHSAINADLPPHIRYSSVQERIAAMAEPSSMPGELEILTASKVLDRPIYILDRNFETISKYGVNTSRMQKPLFVQLHTLGQDVGHYSCLLPTSSQGPSGILGIIRKMSHFPKLRHTRPGSDQAESAAMLTSSPHRAKLLKKQTREATGTQHGNGIGPNSAAVGPSTTVRGSSAVDFGPIAFFVMGKDAPEKQSNKVQVRNDKKNSRITKLKRIVRGKKRDDRSDDQWTCHACGEMLHYHKTPRCSGPASGVLRAKSRPRR